jgi:hypothetical protein
VQETKPKIDKWELLHSQENNQQNQETICRMSKNCDYQSDKGAILRIHKELSKTQ